MAANLRQLSRTRHQSRILEAVREGAGEQAAQAHRPPEEGRHGQGGRAPARRHGWLPEPLRLVADEQGTVEPSAGEPDATIELPQFLSSPDQDMEAPDAEKMRSHWSLRNEDLVRGVVPAVPGFLARPLVRNVVTPYMPRNDITEMIMADRTAVNRVKRQRDARLAEGWQEVACGCPPSKTQKKSET